MNCLMLPKAMAEGRERAMEEGWERAMPGAMDKKLYKAAKTGDVSALYSLHKKGILGQSTPYGNTALHIAASNGHSDFVTKFIQMCKEDIEAWSGTLQAWSIEGNTALHEACSRGREKVVEVLLKEDQQLLHARNSKGETPLFKAAENGHSKIVKRLLEADPSQRLRRVDAQTPLHLAVRNSQKDVIRELLDKNSHLAKEVDYLGRTPLHVAASASLKIVSAWETTWTFSDRDIGGMLIRNKRASCYAVDKFGQTPLHIAVIEGNSAMTKEILKYAPSCVEMVDREGRSALHLAVEYAADIYARSAYDLKRIIVSVSVPLLIDCWDQSQQTALAVAMKKRAEDPQLYTAISNYLLRRGASCHETTSYHETTSNRKSKEGSETAGWTEPITVNISLIATVAFSVAFTLPHVPDSFRNGFLFHLLVITDTLAFCYSLGVALILVYVGGKPDFSISVPMFAAISVAGASLATTFGAAIHIAVAPNYPWLAFLVWPILLCMIFTGINKSHAKIFLFAEPGKHVMSLLLIIVYPVMHILEQLKDFLR